MFHISIAALTRLIVHHADGFGFGQLQCSDPSLPLHFCASLEVVSAAAAAQDNVAGVLCVDVRRGQVDCSSASMGHLCLRPATKHQAEKETEKEHIKNCTLLFVTLSIACRNVHFILLWPISASREARRDREMPHIILQRLTLKAKQQRTLSVVKLNTDLLCITTI